MFLKKLHLTITFYQKDKFIQLIDKNELMVEPCNDNHRIGFFILSSIYQKDLKKKFMNLKKSILIKNSITMRKSKNLNITRPINNKEIKICLDNLDKNGYCKIDNFLTKKTLDNLLELVITNYNKININGKKRYPGTPNRDIRDKIIYNLQNIDILFLDLLSSNSITSIAKN